MLTKSREKWMSPPRESDVPCSPVHNIGELVQHPHTAAPEMILQYQNDENRSINAGAMPLRVAGERA